MKSVFRYAGLFVVMATGIQCTGIQNAITLQSVVSPEGLIVIFCLLSIFALVIYLIIRKYLKRKQIRVEVPEELLDIFQKPINFKFGTKSTQFNCPDNCSYPMVNIRVFERNDNNLVVRSLPSKPDVVIKFTNKQQTPNAELLKTKNVGDQKQNQFK